MKLFSTLFLLGVGQPGEDLGNMKLDGNFLMNKILKIRKLNFNLNNSYDFMRILKNQANNINDCNKMVRIIIFNSLFSTQSYVHNIGFDGSGCAKTDIFKVNL